MGETNEQRILDKLDQIGAGVTVLQTQMPAAQKRSDDHEERLRALEFRVWVAFGVVLVLSFAVPIAMSFIPR